MGSYTERNFFDSGPRVTELMLDIESFIQLYQTYGNRLSIVLREQLDSLLPENASVEVDAANHTIFVRSDEHIDKTALEAAVLSFARRN